MLQGLETDAWSERGDKPGFTGRSPDVLTSSQRSASSWHSATVRNTWVWCYWTHNRTCMLQHKVLGLVYGLDLMCTCEPALNQWILMSYVWQKWSLFSASLSALAEINNVALTATSAEWNLSDLPNFLEKHAVKIIIWLKNKFWLKPDRPTGKTCVSTCDCTCWRAVGHSDVSGEVSRGVTAIEESRKRHNCGGTNIWREKTKKR